MSTSTQLIDEGKDQLNHLQFSSAENSFEKALNQNPRSVEARIGLAQISFVKGEFENGGNLINEALEIQPSNAEGLGLKGVSSMQKQAWEEAIGFLEKARQSDPKLPMIYVNLAKCYRKVGNLKEAEKAAGEAIKLNPENYQAHLQLSGVLFKTKRVKEGIEQVFEAIRINPLYFPAYVLIGRIHQASGNVNDAIDIYDRGLKANPLAIPLREELAGAYAFLGDYQNAFKQAVSITLMRGNDADWLRVGICAVAIGEFEKAEKAFQKTLEVNPNSWEAYYNLGELYFAAKLYEKANQHYVLAIEKDGKSFKPFNGLGMLRLMVDHNPEEAQKYFIKALEVSPGQKEPMLNLALAFAAANDFVSARKLARLTLRVSKSGDGVFEQAERLIAEVVKK